MTDQTLMNRALAAIPGHSDLIDQSARLDTYIKTRRKATQTQDVRAALIDEISAALAAGEDPPADVGDRLAAAEVADRGRALEGDLLGSVSSITRAGARGLAGKLRHDREQLVARHTEPALAVLDADLRDVLDAVSAADATLGGITTAQGAVDAAVAGDMGPTAAWRDLTALIAQYDDIRAAQLSLYSDALGGRRQEAAALMYSGAATIANCAEVDPEWEARLGAAPTAGPPPGPAHATSLADKAWWPTTDRSAYLRWLAAGPPEPWVPPVAAAQAQSSHTEPDRAALLGDYDPEDSLDGGYTGRRSSTDPDAATGARR